MVFAGADEVAEIAYITLQETDLQLAGVVDDELKGGKFFGSDVWPLDAVGSMSYDCIVVTSYLKRNGIYASLLGAGTPEHEIKSIFTVDNVKSES